MNRRSFLGGCAACAALAACGEAAAPRAPFVPIDTGSLPSDAPSFDVVLADHPALVDVGATVFIEVDRHLQLAVTRSGPAEDAFVVLSDSCPHQGCRVLLDGDTFRCPCHQSVFEIDGALVNGPAREGLRAFAFTVAEGVLRVTLQR